MIPYVKTNSMAFSPLANYTNWATAAGRRIYYQLLRVEKWWARRFPTPVNLGFLNPSRYFSVK
jgi:hypothetical protein